MDRAFQGKKRKGEAFTLSCQTGYGPFFEITFIHIYGIDLGDRKKCEEFIWSIL